MKQRIYTDTSVFGGCFDDEFLFYSTQIISEFKEGKKILVVSDLTLQEIEAAPEEVQNLLKTIPDNFREHVVLDKEANILAQKYIKEKAISSKHLVDAQHIAIATINRADVLISWNFKHIVNLRRIHFYNSTNLKHGYPILEIRSPREIIDAS